MNFDSKARRYKGALRKRESMERHSTWRCGGAAANYFEPINLQEIASYLSASGDGENIIWLGLGSNLLVRDGGFSGTIISTAKALCSMSWLQDNTFLYVESGVPCAKVAKEAAIKDRGGLEFLIGIPGTIGGALRMNAGAMGGEIWDFVEEVDTINSLGEIKALAKSEFLPSYRHVEGPSTWFMSARLSLPDSANGDGVRRIQSIMAKRRETQPIGKYSCGSVFTNPNGDFAGRLIESCGLKGCRIGGAVVSNTHANFILNDRCASASDIEKLITHIGAIVFGETGIVLKPEVQIVGDSITKETII